MSEDIASFNFFDSFCHFYDVKVKISIKKYDISKN